MAVAIALFAGPGMIADANSGPEWWSVGEPALPPARAIGSFNRGCLAGGMALPPMGEYYQTMRPSRGRSYGHPDLVAFIDRLAAAMHRQGWPGLLVGDLAQPRGGPMRTGHRSHQTGLDADIWFRPAADRPLTLEERETLPSLDMVNADGDGVNPDHWTEQHGALLKTAASFAEVDRIFVNAAIKRELCRSATGDRVWLRKIRPWWGHDHHFHVRLGCPAGEQACDDGSPLPAGDGCDASLDWWFSAEAKAALADKSKEPPARALTLDDLPTACRAVLSGS
jgi:penicillin-insensitive murein endopeptidase